MVTGTVAPFKSKSSPAPGGLLTHGATDACLATPRSRRDSAPDLWRAGACALRGPGVAHLPGAVLTGAPGSHRRPGLGRLDRVARNLGGRGGRGALGPCRASGRRTDGVPRTHGHHPV